MIDKDSTQRAVSQFSMWSITTPGGTTEKGGATIRNDPSSAKHRKSRMAGGAISPVSQFSNKMLRQATEMSNYNDDSAMNIISRASKMNVIP